MVPPSFTSSPAESTRGDLAFSRIDPPVARSGAIVIPTRPSGRVASCRDHRIGPGGFRQHSRPCRSFRDAAAQAGLRAAKFAPWVPKAAALDELVAPEKVS